MEAETERLLKGSGSFPEVLHRHDLVVCKGAAGQGMPWPGFDADQAEDVDIPAFPRSDSPVKVASKVAGV